MITVEKTTYGNWGNCLKMSNGTIELYATLDFGPRIIRFGVIGSGNMFFENTDRSISESGEAFQVFGENKAWFIYGGHRLWTSPEMMPRSYYPDNDPVAYEVIGNDTIKLTPPPQKWNQYQMELTLTMHEDNSVEVDHTITNIAAWNVELAPWALTVLSQGGLEVIGQPDRPTGLLGNRIMALWPYTKMNDYRVTWGEKYITLRQDTKADCAFKFGLNNEKAYAAYFNHGDLFIKRHFPVLNGNYPDGGMSFETYTNQNFLEMETLGETKNIVPGEAISHKEVWQLYKGVERPENNEEAIDKILKPYIETVK